MIRNPLTSVMLGDLSMSKSQASRPTPEDTTRASSDRNDENANDTRIAKVPTDLKSTVGDIVQASPPLTGQGGTGSGDDPPDDPGQGFRHFPVSNSGDIVQTSPVLNGSGGGWRAERGHFDLRWTHEGHRYCEKYEASLWHESKGRILRKFTSTLKQDDFPKEGEELAVTFQDVTEDPKGDTWCCELRAFYRDHERLSPKVDADKRRAREISWTWMWGPLSSDRLQRASPS
jgi:hypothetical protein